MAFVISFGNGDKIKKPSYRVATRKDDLKLALIIFGLLLLTFFMGYGVGSTPLPATAPVVAPTLSAPVVAPVAAPTDVRVPTQRCQAAAAILERLDSGLDVGQNWTWFGAPQETITLGPSLKAEYDGKGKATSYLIRAANSC